MFIVFIRAVILYCVLILTVRLMGKRQIGELQPAELAVTILISNIATLPVEDSSMPLVKGLVPIITLGCLDVIMSYLGMFHGRVRTFMSGRPVTVISDGKIIRKNMNDLRFTVDDLFEAMHAQNIFDLSEIQYAVVETTGKVSFYQKYENRTTTNKDFNINKKSTDPPMLVIEDGVILSDNLSEMNMTEIELQNILSQKNLRAKDIYILSLERSKSINVLVTKE